MHCPSFIKLTSLTVGRSTEFWKEGVFLQDPALFLQEEADRSSSQLIVELEHTEVPG